MARATIDFGIDLGTTNSSVAVWKGAEGVEIIKNNQGMEYTPSVVYIDKKQAKFVGPRAKERMESDRENTDAEFKQHMGTDYVKTFQLSGLTLKPEELSAEVLKVLKNDASKRLGEDLTAAVITVPADFELPQNSATKRAAELAGIENCILMQEPVAAGLAHGFQNEGDKVFWLVYDFGGGTFDAAVIQFRDGVIQVVNHGGDNRLGGKLIDWAIVEQILIPAVAKEYNVRDFSRKNDAWRSAVAKLKYHAEIAKISLSQDSSTLMLIPDVFRGCPAFKDGTVDFEFELRRADIEPLIAPYVQRSINICKSTLAEKNLKAGSIEKVLLVGGPTLTPYIRDTLKDKKSGLGIPLDTRIDPLTVVARGAAIFAGTQRLEGGTKTASANAVDYVIQFEFKPISPDADPPIAGKIMSPKGGSMSGYTIEFINHKAKPPWRSGKVRVETNGFFMTEVRAEKGKSNTYQIDLLDPRGTKCNTIPETIDYTIGQVIADPPLTHDVGVATAKNEVILFFEKGASLPARKMKTLHTAYQIKSGQTGNLIKVPVIEGQNRKADRNALIGSIEVNASQIKRDLPAGSDVEVTMEIDRSRLVSAKAYIPILDEEYPAVLNLVKTSPDPNVLRQDIAREEERLEKLKEKAAYIDEPQATKNINQIETENTVRDLEHLVEAGQIDKAALDACQKRLQDFRASVDRVEDALELPSLIEEARETFTGTKAVVIENGSVQEKQKLAILHKELDQALASKDLELIKTKVEDLNSLKYSILTKQPSFWVGFLLYLEEKRDSMRNPSQVESLLNQGRQAIDDKDLPKLQAAVRQLLNLLPDEERMEATQAFGSTVV